VGDEALKKYISMYQGPLSPKKIAAIRAATHLSDGHIAKAATTLATEELATQVDAAMA
jgi:hypothetical protein